MVNEKPFCIWDWELPEQNLRFLDGIDPEYFAHMGKVHSAELNGENRQRAAVALRLAYSQALETFFAFVGAAIQAPECPLGWVLRYETGDLRAVIRSVASGGPRLTRIKPPISWPRLSSIINNYQMEDQDRLRMLQAGYADAWSRLAAEFLSRDSMDEYNSLKHGLRSRPGGAAIRMGIEEVPGIEAPPENMGDWIGSEFGTSYHVTEWFGTPKVNFRAVPTSRNWHPENLTAGLHLLAVSTANVISYLKVAGGRKFSEVSVKVPVDPDFFTNPWQVGSSLMSLSIDFPIALADIAPQSKEEILRTYELPQPELSGGNADQQEEQSQ